jgi:hypothetical protein
MKLNLNLFLAFSFLALTTGMVGCAAVNSVSLTPIPAQRNHPVKAEVSKWIFLGFSFDNDFIDPLVSDLKQKCPNGVISGILTKDETISYFLLFKKHVSATGYCNIATAKTAQTQGKNRQPGSAENATDASVEN